MNSYLKQLVSNKALPVIFDYDGVLFEARWYHSRINMPNETEAMLEMAHKRGENLKTTPLPPVMDWVKTLDNDLYVLSHMHTDIEYDFKKQQIARYYPNISSENVIRAKSPEDKLWHLEQLKDRYSGFIYIDDNHSLLIRMENHFDNCCKFFHASSLFV